MRIHYVEDNALDAKILTEMVGEERDIQLNISERIEDFQRLSQLGPADFVLLDVRRPDAISIEDDIKRVREFTDAPIVFVTSDDAENMRQEAVSSGAEAVIDKIDLSSKLLKQILANSKWRRKAPDQPAEGKVSSRDIKRSVESLRGPFSYIELSLQTLLETMEDSGRSSTADYVAHLLETVRAIRAYSEDDLSQATRTPIHELLLETAERVSSTAQSKQVNLVFETETSWFTQIGSRPLATLGIQHLVAGILRACEKGDRVSIRSERHEDGIALNIFVSRAVIPSKEALFDLTKAAPSLGLDSKASLQLGLTLLSVPPEQVDVHVHNGNLFLKLIV
ncbi:response regulator [Ponticaulis sp.]|uniref:response regulator n=1 Tax=Ponticaulis sp. TaxID=2020902 RepID=UPI000B73F987|nr:response regulator [Ponticaulis sp.]MAJ09903.1 hypothetical protein [Ponticaulis sp.]MDF1680847.1 response regulator [Ponticaulis sp.]RPG18515.1 MAG: response regulator [Hyphomonadaceae bacterium TMED125]HBH89578.1 hypothetical protein [Hyphomonadaceae bacterium]|tara:strand:+ start:25159 stop:26169 length:1011 start_codon:yes stop_codon:yes gene_type:complete